MYNEKPVIGVMPLYDDEKDSYWMLPEYMQGLEEQGAIPLMLSLCTNEDELNYFKCDGFLLTGGHDVSPMMYDAEILPKCGAVSIKRDKMDEYILKSSVNRHHIGFERGLFKRKFFFTL